MPSSRLHHRGMPRPLTFKPDAVDPILKGAKRLTVRRPEGLYSAGDIVKAMKRGQPAFAELRIVEVERLRLSEFTEQHAARDGNGGLASLREAAKSLYPDERTFDVITFERVRSRKANGRPSA
jgi:uncharacterized protein YqfB (UPF0267 family)